MSIFGTPTYILRPSGKSKMQFYTYLQVLEKETNTEYGRRMWRLRNAIFGEPTRPEQHKTRNTYVYRTLQKEPVHKMESMTQYYPRHQETHRFIMALRDYGLFRDEHQDFKEEMIRLRTLRGKPPFNPKAKGVFKSKKATATS